MDAHEECRELDIAEIDTVSGGMTYGQMIQDTLDHVDCAKYGGAWYDNGDSTLCVR